MVFWVTLLSISCFPGAGQQVHLFNVHNTPLQVDVSQRDYLVVFSDDPKKFAHCLWLLDAQCPKFIPIFASETASEEGFFPIFRLEGFKPQAQGLSYLLLKKSVNQPRWHSVPPSVGHILKERCLDQNTLFMALGTEFVVLQSHENACGNAVKLRR